MTTTGEEKSLWERITDKVTPYGINTRGFSAIEIYQKTKKEAEEGNVPDDVVREVKQILKEEGRM